MFCNDILENSDVFYFHEMIPKGIFCVFFLHHKMEKSDEIAIALFGISRIKVFLKKKKTLLLTYRPLCSVSRWRPQKVDKRMVLEYTHGLFIT